MCAAGNRRPYTGGCVCVPRLQSPWQVGPDVLVRGVCAGCVLQSRGFAIVATEGCAVVCILEKGRRCSTNPYCCRLFLTCMRCTTQAPRRSHKPRCGVMPAVDWFAGIQQPSAVSLPCLGAGRCLLGQRHQVSQGCPVCGGAQHCGSFSMAAAGACLLKDGAAVLCGLRVRSCGGLAAGSNGVVACAGQGSLYPVPAAGALRHLHPH